MLRLRDVPLFSQLSDEDFAIVKSCARGMEFPAGAHLCRAGDPGRLLHVLVAGAVKVETGSRRGVVLGPGQVIGELSILSGRPVSASVTALYPVSTYAFDKPAFLRLLQTSHVLHRSLSELLVERVLERPSDARPAPACVIILLPQPALARLARMLFCRLRAYEARALYCEFGAPGADDAPTVAGGLPSALGCPASAGAALADAGTYLVDRRRCAPAEVVAGWRAAEHAEGPLVLALSASALDASPPSLEQGDTLIVLSDSDAEGRTAASEQAAFASADRIELALDEDPLMLAGCPGGRWRPRLDDSWRCGRLSDQASRSLDLVARRVLRRSVGVALGAGAARGLAHLGVLQVLERAGVPFDELAGTSIGGIVALAFGLSGSADGAIAIMREHMGRRDKVLDRFKTYHASYYAGAKIRRSARTVFGDLRIEQLRRPVAVVAADLVSGDKVVLDHGSIARALLATSAIPGIFPPVEHDGRLLFDGASVSRVPVDLLDARRCALKIAVNVAPRPRHNEPSLHATRRSIFRFMGFRNVWMRNWEVQAYWDGVKETASADVLLEPDTAGFSMFDFDHFDELLDLGRRAAEDNLGALRSAFELSVGPGAK